MNTGYPQSQPPSAGFTQVPPQVTTVVIAPPMFGENPVQVTCSNCQKTVVTTTTTTNGACAYIAALFVCLICCPCFWIPLVMDSCKDTQHTCPSCGAMMGTHRRC